ncbi:MAG: triose-phosphate isomerase [Candidatus Bathyarchaeota archaeon]
MKHIQTPLIIINFKTYQEGTGKNALKLAKIAEKINKITGVNICVSPQYTDLAIIASKVAVPVFAQHIDPITFGAYTGHILPEAVKEAGAIGTLINHSARPLLLKDIEKAIERAKNLNLISAICSDTPKTAASVSYLKPNIVSVEPPELIGTGIPVSKARPGEVLETISLVRKVDASAIILCGAGITTGVDTEAALKLGANGVLLSSGVVKAKNQEAALLDIAEAMSKIR